MSLRRAESDLNYLIRYSPAYEDIINIDMSSLRGQLRSLRHVENDEVDVMDAFLRIENQDGGADV